MFRQLFDAESSTYTYILMSDADHNAVIVDPVREQVDRDLQVLRSMDAKVQWILETHVHADHVTGARALKEKLGASTAVSLHCGATGFDRLLEDGDVITFGDERLRAIATPGHTPGSTCYLWRDRLLSGDTLLIGGCGRTDFQGGSAATLYDSITQKLFTLPDDTLVYPGHDYKHRFVSTIAEEKISNPRFKNKSKEEFITLMNELNLPPPMKMQIAVPANLTGGTA